MERNIEHLWFFPHSPELVWDYLTKPELLSQWLMENDIKAEVGHKFMFHTKPKIKLGFDGNIYCEVLDVVPYKKLSYTWKGGPKPGKINLDTVVTWTLTPKNNGTELLLEQKGFKGMRNYISYIFMNAGWVKIYKRWLAKVNSSK